MGLKRDPIAEPGTPRPCAVCQKEFVSENLYARFCSLECSYNYNYAKKPKFYIKQRANDLTEVATWDELETSEDFKPRNEGTICPLVLKGAEMAHGDYSGNKYIRWDLRWANMVGSNFSMCNFKRADMRCANLEGADLRDTNLEYARLEAANLKNVDLRGAIMTRTDLTHADLTGANLEGVQMGSAITLFTIGIEDREPEHDADDMIMITNPLDLNAGYRFGFDNMEPISEEMVHGKPIMVREDAGLLSQIIYNTQGNHLEIGSGYGGSALIALRTLDWLLRKDKITCIDPLKNQQKHVVLKYSFEDFSENVEHFGYKNRVELVRSYSHPFPEELKGRRFSTALIDGNHSYSFVLNDWNNLKDIVDDYIMFHDYIKPKVARVVKENAAHDKDWEVVAIHGWSAVLKRKN